MSIHYRKGTIEDSFRVFQVFIQAIMDLGRRTNTMAITDGGDPGVLDSLWQKRRPMFEFLARSCAHFWLAEQDGDIVGYARSMEHAGLLELTEFFVLPNRQSGGVGRQLLARAFPESGRRDRAIIATLDERALYRYLSTGLSARFPIKYFHRQAEKVEFQSDLQIEPVQLEIHLQQMNRIDRRILGHTREMIHRWLNETRSGLIYKRRGEIVGYGYPGEGAGPFALLDENDFPAVLAHAESLAAARGQDFRVETPLINSRAVQYFTERRYRMDSFTVVFMSNRPFGAFENYLCFSPIFFF